MTTEQPIDARHFSSKLDFLINEPLDEERNLVSFFRVLKGLIDSQFPNNQDISFYTVEDMVDEICEMEEINETTEILLILEDNWN